MSTGYLQVLTEQDLDWVLKIRNHPKVRGYMFNQKEIEIQEHLAWFQGMANKSGVDLLLFLIDMKKSGFAQIKDTKSSGVSNWGCYVDPDAPKGTGRKLGLAVIEYAFKIKKLHKICSQALIGNEPSIKMHLALGFQQEGILKDQYFDGNRYHDVICFGMVNQLSQKIMIGNIK